MSAQFPIARPFGQRAPTPTPANSPGEPPARARPPSWAGAEGGPAQPLAPARGAHRSLDDVPRVRMTWGELHFSALVGVQRQFENLQDGRVDRYGCPESVGWQMHIEGCGGEAAVAKYLDRWWSGALGNLRADDVGSYQVRTCNPAGKQKFSLILHDGDPDEKIFIMALGLYREDGQPVYRLPGWIRAGEGKQQRWWWEPKGNGRPAYFVPWQELRPMGELPVLR